MTFDISFFGAAGTVTGSRTLIRHNGQQLLVDCGQFQGLKSLKERNWEAFYPEASSINAVIVTHAHLDHSGLLPRLVKEGFHGPIYCSQGTADLLAIVLMDAAQLQEEDSDFANKTKYSRHDPALPLFTKDDVEMTLGLIKPCSQEVWTEALPHIPFRLRRAGHIIGASMVELLLTSENGSTQTVVFTGDMGRFNSPTMRRPLMIENADYLIIESTYGDRLHPREDLLPKLAEIANRTFNRGGTLMIPSFAIGRTQDLLYFFKLLQESKQIPREVEIVLDSPMGAKATEVFLNHTENIKPNVADRIQSKHFLPENFKCISSSEESFEYCMREEPKVIIAGAGMLSGGRILHHLKKRLGDSRHTVMFSGYQPEGTKGRYLMEKGRTLGDFRIHHQEVPVEAEIVELLGLSAHADQKDLLNWVDHIKQKPKMVFVNHGEMKSSQALAEQLKGLLPQSEIFALTCDLSLRI